MLEIANTAKNEAIAISKKDLFGIQKEQQEYRDKVDQNIKYILEKIALLEQRNIALNKEHMDILNEQENNSYSELPSELSCDDLCKKLNIKGLDSPHLNFIYMKTELWI